MKKKQFDKAAAAMDKFKEPDEQVTDIATARASSPWTLFLIAIFPWLNKPRLLVLTDKNVYVMRGMAKPSRELAKYPLGSTPVSTGKKRLAMLEVNVGPTRVWVPKMEQGAARELVAKASTPQG